MYPNSTRISELLEESSAKINITLKQKSNVFCWLLSVGGCSQLLVVIHPFENLMKAIDLFLGKCTYVDKLIYIPTPSAEPRLKTLNIHIQECTIALWQLLSTGTPTIKRDILQSAIWFLCHMSLLFQSFQIRMNRRMKSHSGYLWKVGFLGTFTFCMMDFCNV